MIRSFLFLLFCLNTLALGSEDDAGDVCESSSDNGSCSVPRENFSGAWEDANERELALGLNALPARMAAVSGQLQDLQTCGPWCHDDATKDPTTPCRMDPALVPCEGDFYCTTTCALWRRSVLLDPLNYNDAVPPVRPVTSCPMFARFDGFLSTHTVEACDASCLLPEIRPHRYPAPTGLGLLCQTGTCYAGASALADVLPNIPSRLECPCNWFGSDCPDDWKPVRAIDHTGTYGSTIATTLIVGREDLAALLARHQPGGVIRLTQRDPDRRNATHPEHTRVQEQPYALAQARLEGETGFLEILTAPPDPSLHLQSRAVAERVRGLPSGGVEGNLFVNPSIAGFFNSQWQFLLPVLREEGPSVRHVVLLSTGAGLSGILSALDALQEQVAESALNAIRSIRVYHGVRSADEVPYAERLSDFVATLPSVGHLTIVESRKPSPAVGGNQLSQEMAAAVARGRELRQTLLSSSSVAGKVYVQMAVQHDLRSGAASDIRIDNTLFVVCGRLELLEESKKMLEETYCTDPATADECQTRLGIHFFTNI